MTTFKTFEIFQNFLLIRRIAHGVEHDLRCRGAAARQSTSSTLRILLGVHERREALRDETQQIIELDRVPARHQRPRDLVDHARPSVCVPDQLHACHQPQRLVRLVQLDLLHVHQYIPAGGRHVSSDERSARNLVVPRSTSREREGQLAAVLFPSLSEDHSGFAGARLRDGFVLPALRGRPLSQELAVVQSAALSELLVGDVPAHPKLLQSSDFGKNFRNFSPNSM